MKQHGLYLFSAWHGKSSIPHGFLFSCSGSGGKLLGVGSLLLMTVVTTVICKSFLLHPNQTTLQGSSVPAELKQESRRLKSQET